MSKHKIETKVIHAGQEADPSTGAVMPPIYQTSTYKQQGVGKHSGYEYSRTGNPTRSALEANLAALEGGKYGLAFASGMAAIDTVLRTLEPGDHILAGNDVYGGTFRLFEKEFKRYGLNFSYVDTTDLKAVAAELRPETRLVWIESPTNPMLRITDIAAISKLAHEYSEKIVVGVDNTFATPYLQQPIRLGADLVVHSTTKYMGGHSDVVGGAAISNDEALHERLAFLQNAVGAVPGPMDSFLVLRGIKTLPVRMDRHAENANTVAEFLDDLLQVEKMIYPGHASHPEYEIAKKQMRNGGGMVSFILKGGAEEALRVAERTKLFTLAESLGGVESLIEVPAAMTHASTADSALAVDTGLVRLSVGLEHIDDLIEDLAQAISK